MKFRKLLIFCLAAFMMLVISSPAMAKVVSPSDQFYFLDDANVLSEATEGEIFFSNVRLDEACGAQFVVVTLKTTGSEAIDDYAYELINSWKIGDSRKQNGLLLLLAIDDDNYYIEPGTGLQSKLSAGSLGGYVDDYLEPEFAAQRYDAAVKGFFEAVFARIADTYNADVTTQQGIADYEAWLAEGNSASNLSAGIDYRGGETDEDEEDLAYGIFGFVVFVLFIILIVLLISRSRRRRRAYGGVNPGVIITPGPIVPPRGPVNGAGPGGYRGANVPPSRPAGGGFRTPTGGGLFGGTPRSSGGLFGGSSSSRPTSGSLFGSGSSSRSSSGGLFGGSSSRSGGLFGGSSSRSSGGSRSFGSARGGGGGSRGGGIGRGRH